MKTTATLARLLLGFVLFASGLSGFVFAILAFSLPMPPGLAGAFQNVFFRSHWVLFVDGVEFLSGALLLSNRYVPLALTALAGVIANILVFHITMLPSGLPVALFVGLLWTVTALPFRANFAPLFVSKATPVVETAIELQLARARA